MSVLILDATVLSHFARTGNLDVLESLLAGQRCVMPAEVARELAAAIPDFPALARAIDLHWVETVELVDLAEIMAFARYKTEYGGGTERNSGEAAVLAYAAVHHGIAIVDERAATRAARRDKIETHGTLWLIRSQNARGRPRDGRRDHQVLVAPGGSDPHDRLPRSEAGPTIEEFAGRVEVAEVTGSLFDHVENDRAQIGDLTIQLTAAPADPWLTQ